MANIGYIRVSSSQQNTARQHIDLSSAGITIVEPLPLIEARDS